MSDEEQVIFENYRDGIVALVDWSHRELTPGQLMRVLDSVKLERRKLGQTVEACFLG